MSITRLRLPHVHVHPHSTKNKQKSAHNDTANNNFPQIRKSGKTKTIEMSTNSNSCGLIFDWKTDFLVNSLYLILLSTRYLHSLKFHKKIK
jgi:hypothetical protein